MPVQSLKESGSNPEEPGVRSPHRMFQSILFGESPGNALASSGEAPDYFSDLNLDQIVEAVTAGRDEYDLKPFFYQPLGGLDQTERFKPPDLSSAFGRRRGWELH